MRAPLALALILLVPIAPLGGSEPADAADAARVEKALTYLASQQGSDGRWGDFTANVVEAVASAGVDPKRWPTPDRSAWSALGRDRCRTSATSLPAQCQDFEYKKMLRSVHAAGVSGYDPRELNGIDGVAAVRAGFVGGQFGDPTYVNDDVWAILALRAAGIPANDTQIAGGVEQIRRARFADGGWGWQMVGRESDLDSTAHALAALHAAGADLRDDEDAKRFVLGKWDRASGGFASGAIPLNNQSTSWAISAMAILGIETNDTALDYLRRWQRADGAIGPGFASFSTAESMIPLTGARFPLAGHVEHEMPAITCHAREPARLALGGPFTSATWTFHGFTLNGTSPTHTFPTAGTYAFRVHAEGPDARWRGEGSVTVLSARPVLGGFPENVTLARFAPLALDTSTARDPDGAIAGFEVDWGDGNATSTTAHAYERPGTYPISLRAQDDAGIWSEPARLTAIVQNRAPAISLPTRIASDRVEGVALTAIASDPEGDAIGLRWSFGNVSGEGAPRFIPSALGEQPLRVIATDRYGASVEASTIVEVVNLAPTIRLVDGDEVTAVAEDPDGPAPAVSWIVDGAPARAPIRLAPGTHDVRAIVTDADGASSEARATLMRERSAAPAPTRAPPEVLRLDAALVDGALTGSFEVQPAGARVVLAWRSDTGEGEREVASPFSIALPDATWAAATLTAHADGLTATRATRLLTSAPAPEEAPAIAPAEAVVVAPLAAAVEDPDAPIEPASLNGGSAAARATPGPGAAILLATLGTLAAWRGRSPRTGRR